MIGLVAVRSSKTESNPRFKEAVEKLKEKKKVLIAPPVVQVKEVVPEPVKIKVDRKEFERCSIREIITIIAEEHGRTYEDLIKPSRYRKDVMARDEAISAVATAKPGMSAESIGRAFGGRHHTTILHSLKKVKQYV